MFLSFDSIGQPKAQQFLEKSRKSYPRTSSFRNSRNVPNGFWNSSKNAPRAFYLFILFFFYSSLLEYQQKIEEPRFVGHSKVSRFVLPIVGKRETRSSRGNATDPHCEIVSNVADLFLLRERRRICSREEESSIAFPQCS